MSTADDERIVALRQEIRRTAQSSVARLGLRAGVVGVPLTALLLGIVYWSEGFRPAAETRDPMLLGVITLGLIGGMLAAFGLQARETRRELARLREAMHGLTASDRRRVLQPFGAEFGDMAADSLADQIRDRLRRPSDLATAELPDARGDEASPADRPP